MVRLGFICEGATEKLIVESYQFRQLLLSNNIELIEPVIDANGGGNLLPKNIEQFVSILSHAGAEKIFILTDLDEEECVANTKERIHPTENQSVIVSVKEIESWFLADGETLSVIFNQENYSFENPEEVKNPFKKIQQEFVKYNLPSPASKLKLAYKMIDRGFNIDKAASHATCNSAKYFLKKLQENNL